MDALLRFGVVVLGAAAIAASSAVPSAPPSGASDLAGTWAGTITHEGETQSVALEFEADASGKITVALSMPVVHLERMPIARSRPSFRGDSVQIGPMSFAYDRAAATLRGLMPAGLIPVYAPQLALRKVEHFEMPARPALTAPEATPLWTYEANTPLWAGPTVTDGVVYAGGQDGSLHAIDARTGTRRWIARAGGPIRVRPTIARGVFYVQADDGWLYAFDVQSGRQRWRVQIVDRAIDRLPFDDPASRFDRFGSDVVVSGGRAYVGTHDGMLLALDARNGRTLWKFKAGDAILAAPAVVDGRVVFGSYDRCVYALDAGTGQLLWKRDTQGAVVSTPAVSGDRVVVGNRSYDLLGLELSTGEVAWKRYIWMSWVESSVAVRDGIAYVGSSDAVAVFAFETHSGKRLWASDVFGWSWGQPAVTADRVYAATSSQVGYLERHQGGLLALDRATGTAVWRYAAASPDSGMYGFPGSPALDANRVFVTGFDGRILAFAR